MLRAVEVENRSFIVASFAEQVAVFSLSRLKVMREPFRNVLGDVIVLGKSWFD